MSELIAKCENGTGIRWQLLAGVSALALAVSNTTASAENDTHPNVWIEVGGQLSRTNEYAEPFAPDFTSMRPSIFLPSQKLEKSPRVSFDEYAKISVQPTNSEWSFSASVQYGRASRNKHVRQQTYPSPRYNDLYPDYPSSVSYLVKPRAARFADTAIRNSEQHLIVDFQAGKDVGLGLFGGSGSSVVSLGVRFAQFVGKSNISLKSDPDWRFQPKYITLYSRRVQFLLQPYHSNAANLVADRSFHGAGPTLSWNASLPVAGDVHDSELDFDWGVNAAVLFGRQKASIKHDTEMRYNDGGRAPVVYITRGTLTTVYHHKPPRQDRIRSVLVPNIGGFAGLSVRYSNAKISFGYKADLFFGAMDGGIDARKTYDRNFYGPFAAISIRLGG